MSSFLFRLLFRFVGGVSFHSVFVAAFGRAVSDGANARAAIGKTFAAGDTNEFFARRRLAVLRPDLFVVSVFTRPIFLNLLLSFYVGAFGRAEFRTLDVARE